MSEWKTIPADVFCDSVRDGTHDTPKQVKKGYKLVTAKHINNGQIDLSDAYLISEKDYLKINERSKVEQWDVLMSMIGNGLGKSAVVKESPEYAIKNLALFKLGNEIKAKWLHYYLSSKAGQGFIYNSLQGSGQPFISLSLLRKFPIPVPNDETIMGNVVTVLSRYDSLIENYQKQIKLLEEAAQRLYKEWFVDLHFPGHENTKIVDGVPEGWEKKKIGDIVKIKSGYAFKSKDWQSTGCPVVKIKDITGTFVNSGLLDCVSFDIASKAKQYLLNSGDLVIAMTGATIGKIGIIVDNGLYTNQRVGKFFLKEEDLPFIYCFFKQESSQKQIIQLSSASSAQPNISGAQLESFSFVYNEELYNKYNLECISLFKQMISLQSQIRLLTEARDRLLPKLMSGEIAV